MNIHAYLHRYFNLLCIKSKPFSNCFDVAFIIRFAFFYCVFLFSRVCGIPPVSFCVCVFFHHSPEINAVFVLPLFGKAKAHKRKLHQKKTKPNKQPYTRITAQLCTEHSEKPTEHTTTTSKQSKHTATGQRTWHKQYKKKSE